MKTMAILRGTEMNIAIWVVQVLLAVFLILFGFIKAFLPIDGMADQMPFVLDVPEALVRFIGVAELAGAFGLILPAITRILPRLTIAAAGGLGTIMILAFIFGVSRGEIPNAVINIVVLAVLAFIAYGRWKLIPISARS